MRVRIAANLIALSFLFAVPTLADDDPIRIFIINENGHIEQSYVSDCLTNYLALLPQVDGDTIEIRGRADYGQWHSAEYSTNVEIADELFGLLRDFSQAKVFGFNQSMLEFHFEYEDSWYIVERYEYSVENRLGNSARAVRVKISRPNKIHLPSEVRVVTPAHNEYVNPFTGTKKLYFPYPYGLVGCYGVGNLWRLDFEGNCRSRCQHRAVAERNIVDADSGELLKEFTIGELGNVGW